MDLQTPAALILRIGKEEHALAMELVNRASYNGPDPAPEETERLRARQRAMRDVFDWIKEIEIEHVNARLNEVVIEITPEAAKFAPHEARSTGGNTGGGTGCLTMAQQENFSGRDAALRLRNVGEAIHAGRVSGTPVHADMLLNGAAVIERLDAALKKIEDVTERDHVDSDFGQIHRIARRARDGK